MLNLVRIASIVLLGCLIGYGSGWWRANDKRETELGRVVAMSRGGGKYGPAVYLAEVYVEPQGTGFSANARVYIEGASYFHNCGVLGQVQTMAEANDRWGKIDWREDGLHIGTGTNEYFLSRAKLESHR